MKRTPDPPVSRHHKSFASTSFGLHDAVTISLHPYSRVHTAGRCRSAGDRRSARERRGLPHRRVMRLGPAAKVAATATGIIAVVYVLGVVVLNLVLSSRLAQQNDNRLADH